MPWKRHLGSEVLSSEGHQGIVLCLLQLNDGYSACLASCPEAVEVVQVSISLIEG